MSKTKDKIGLLTIGVRRDAFDRVSHVWFRCSEGLGARIEEKGLKWAVPAERKSRTVALSLVGTFKDERGVAFTWQRKPKKKAAGFVYIELPVDRVPSYIAKAAARRKKRDNLTTIGVLYDNGTVQIRRPSKRALISDDFA